MTLLVVVTDSMGVYKQVQRLRSGVEASMRHADLWRAATPLLHKITEAIWVKAHQPAEEALQNADVGKYPVQHWVGKARTQSWGIGALGVGRMAAPTTYEVARATSWMGRTYTAATRHRAEKPTTHFCFPPRGGLTVERADALWAYQHNIGSCGATQGCKRCRRTSCKGKHHARLKQWRQHCIPLQIHERCLARRHLLVWQWKWARRKRAIATHSAI